MLTSAQSHLGSCRGSGDAQSVDTPLETYFALDPLGSNCDFLIQGNSLCPLTSRVLSLHGPLVPSTSGMPGSGECEDVGVWGYSTAGSEGLYSLIGLIPYPEAWYAAPVIPHHIPNQDQCNE